MSVTVSAAMKKWGWGQTFATACVGLFAVGAFYMTELVNSSQNGKQTDTPSVQETSKVMASAYSHEDYRMAHREIFAYATPAEKNPDVKPQEAVPPEASRIQVEEPKTETASPATLSATIRNLVPEDMRGRLSAKTHQLVQQAEKTGSKKLMLISFQAAANDFLTGKNRNSQTRRVATALTLKGVECAEEFRMTKTTVAKQLNRDAHFLRKAHRNYAQNIAPSGGFNRHLRFN